VKDENDIAYVIGEIDKTAEAFGTTLVSRDELEKTKKRSRYSYLMSLDTPERVGSVLARMVTLTGGIETVDQLYTTMNSLTPEDIQAAARKYLRKEHRTVLVLKGAKS
jgi:zinc protease